MNTIQAQVPDAVLQQARELAERERIPLEQLISLAVTQTVGVWSNESCLATRAKRGSREKFLQAWTKCPTSSHRNGIGCRRGIGGRTDAFSSRL